MSLAQHASQLFSRAARQSSLFWTHADLEQYCTPYDVKRLVVQIWLWRGISACILIGFIVGAVIMKAILPEPGQRYRFYFTVEAIPIEAAATAGQHTGGAK